jgi:hypothetical protein
LIAAQQMGSSGSSDRVAPNQFNDLGAMEKSKNVHTKKKAVVVRTDGNNNRYRATVVG